ncbi:hypothetical protein [uncultured Pseudacidovorax sp.]|nr:hypothetical protein [uncultured Pseudacidovorax sp.]
MTAAALALGVGLGFLVAVVFVMLVDGAHMAAERSRRIRIARSRHA